MSDVQTPDGARPPGGRPGDSPSLTHLSVPDEARAVVLVLHGGAVSSTRPVDKRSLSYHRARRLYDDIRRPLAANDLGTCLLRFRVKGWNARLGPEPAPIPDARWALDELGRSAGRSRLPVILLGHSMGARTAAAVADHPDVLGVVALAPWFPADEPVAALRGKPLRAAHGRTDKITSAQMTRAFVERSTRQHPPTDATFTDMGALGHYLLRGVRAWNTFAVDSCLDLARSAPPAT